MFKIGGLKWLSSANQRGQEAMKGGPKMPSPPKLVQI